MNVAEEVINPNLITGYLLYGMTFVVMGVAILMKIRSQSEFLLGRNLWLLGAYGLVHGLADWGEVLLPLYRLTLLPALVVPLELLQKVLISFSFALLLRFGVNLLAGERRDSRLVRWLPAAAWTLWLGLFIFRYPWLREAAREKWLVTSGVISRYMLGLPGAWITSRALYILSRELRELDMPTVVRHLLGAAMSFAVYGVAAGLVVEKASFFPASLINHASFSRYTGMPVEALRILCAVAIAYFVIRSLEVFDIELQRRVEESELKRHILQERERIARDLHDGIIQSIYGVGLKLENLTFQLPESSHVREEIGAAMERLNDTIKDIRRYIMALHPERFSTRDPLGTLRDLVAGFRSSTGIQAHLSLKHVDAGHLRAEQWTHVFHILQEALNNVQQHARASRVLVSMELTGPELVLLIRDNGRGFSPDNDSIPGDQGRRQGLHNMAERAAILQGRLEVTSLPRRGTELRLTIPRGV